MGRNIRAMSELSRGMIFRRIFDMGNVDTYRWGLGRGERGAGEDHSE